MTKQKCTVCDKEIKSGMRIIVICEDSERFYFCNSLCASYWLDPHARIYKQKQK